MAAINEAILVAVGVPRRLLLLLGVMLWKLHVRLLLALLL